VETIHADMERDRFMTPDEGQAYGLIDSVIASRNANANGNGNGNGHG
jgi:ATP-dependent protease ClpP protease subunit